MSHEGIRIAPENAARRAAEEAELPRDAITPQQVRVDKTAGTGMTIEWTDGHTSHWTFQWLRDACPCATCVDQRESTGREPGQPKLEPKTALPMYKAPVRPNNAHAVGRYAISFDWNDGHTSGIYSWRYLRTVCQCGECITRSATPDAKS
jgi:DUF971 family protein